MAFGCHGVRRCKWIITEAQHIELSETLYHALIRRLNGETNEGRALIDSSDLAGLIEKLVEL